MILDDIVANAREELREKKRRVSLRDLASAAADMPAPLDFAALHARTPGVKIIAEIKKASPSCGVIREDFDHLSIAAEYEEAGAFGLSVLTDAKFFQGDASYLSDVRERSRLPLLRKDFTVDAYHVYEARCLGADLVLLIAAVLGGGRMEEYLGLARSLGMGCVAEVHCGEELETALSAGAEIVGINNRDLRDFSVSLDVSKKLAREVPEGKIVISESGISSPEDVAELAAAGIDTFLVGETFMKSESPGAALRGLLCGESFSETANGR